jgi:hypothetical protein
MKHAPTGFSRKLAPRAVENRWKLRSFCKSQYVLSDVSSHFYMHISSRTLRNTRRMPCGSYYVYTMCLPAHNVLHLHGVCIYIYTHTRICMYTHTHTHTPLFCFSAAGQIPRPQDKMSRGTRVILPFQSVCEQYSLRLHVCICVKYIRPSLLASYPQEQYIRTHTHAHINMRNISTRKLRA